jgi:hypothetical protein
VIGAGGIARSLGGRASADGYLCRCPLPSHGRGRGDRNRFYDKHKHDHHHLADAQLGKRSLVGSRTEWMQSAPLAHVYPADKPASDMGRDL